MPNIGLSSMGVAIRFSLLYCTDFSQVSDQRVLGDCMMSTLVEGIGHTSVSLNISSWRWNIDTVISQSSPVF